MRVLCSVLRVLRAERAALDDARLHLACVLNHGRINGGGGGFGYTEWPGPGAIGVWHLHGQVLQMWHQQLVQTPKFDASPRSRSAFPHG